MSPVQHLREFIRQRLTAAAEEIFTEVEKNIVQYQEEIDRQRKQLETSSKPRIQLPMIDVLHQHVSKDEEALLADQQLCKQTSTSSMNKVEPESLHIKEEQEDLAIQEEEEQLELKHETDSFSNTPTHEENDYNDPESNNDGIPVYTCPLDEHLHLEESRLEDLEPTRYSELNPDRSSLRNSNDNLKTSLWVESRVKTDRTAEKLYICYTCNKRFSNLSSLQKHNAVHTGVKPYSCKTCGKRFSRKDVLLGHMKTHTGERPFSCKICGKCFTRNYHLLCHVRRHTGENLHSCKTCGKGFGRKDSLLRHMKTHTD